MSAALPENDRWIRYGPMTGGETELPYDFPIADADDLVVVRRRNQANSTLTRASQYTVAGVGDAGGGAVTLTPAAVAGDYYTLYSDEPAERANLFAATPPITSAKLDPDASKLMRLGHELRRDLDRVPFRWPASAAGPVLTLTEEPSERANQVVGFDGVGAPALITPAAITGIGVVVPDGGTTNVSFATFLAAYAMPEAWGAAGDGTTNDYAALAAAATYAKAWGAPMTLDRRRTYGFLGQLVAECSIEGNGATLRPLTAWDTVSTNNRNTLYNNGASDLTWRNFTVDTQGRSVGVWVYDGDRIVLERVKAKDARFIGIDVRKVNGLRLTDCEAETVKFTDPSTPGASVNKAADGIYVGGCTDVLLRGCRASDIQAIGIVVEDEGVASSDVTISDCHVWNLNNDALTKAGSRNGAALWCELVERRLTVTNFHCWDLAGNANQSVVFGINVSPANGVPTVVQIANCTVRGTEPGEAVQSLKALQLGANSVTARLHYKVEDVAISNAKGQVLNVSTGADAPGTIDAVELDRISFDGCELAGASSGLVFVQGSGTIRKLSIRDPLRSVAIAPGTDADFGDLKITGPTVNDLELRGLEGWHVILDGGPAKIARQTVARSVLTFGTTSSADAPLAGQNTILEDVVFTPWVPTGGAFVGSHRAALAVALGYVVHHNGVYWECTDAGLGTTDNPADPPTGAGPYTEAVSGVEWTQIHADRVFPKAPSAGRVNVTGRNVTLVGAVEIDADGSHHHRFTGLFCSTGALLRYKPVLSDAAHEAVLEIFGGRVEGYDAEFSWLRTNYYAAAAELGVRRIVVKDVQVDLDEIGTSVNVIERNAAGKKEPVDFITRDNRSFGTLVGTVTGSTNNVHADHTIS